MVTFRSATKVAQMCFLTALISASAFGAGSVRQVPVKFRWLTADVAWDSVNRNALTRAQMEVEVPEEGYPVIGLAVAPTLVQWDGSALHPSLLAEVPGKPGLRYLKVKVEAQTIHQLSLEYDAGMEKVDAVPVSIETAPFPFVLRFDAPLLPEQELLTNGLALPAGEGKWAVRFAESSSGFYLTLPDPAEDRKGGLGKLFRWLIRLPISILGGGGDGPPPLINFRRKH